MRASEIREDFPIFKKRINNNPLIYFDNAATTQKPKQVIEAEQNFYENYNANIHRAVYTLSQQATELYETSRDYVAKFINASDSSEIIFVKGTTEAINLVAYSWGLHNLKKGDEILLSVMEHHSNIIPWEIISNITGSKVKYVQICENGTLDYSDFDQNISEKTKITCINHVSNVTGIINDVKSISKIAHEHGSLVLVDAAQSVPHMPVDVQDLDADFLAFSGHKMLGPTGVGVLYGKSNILEKMQPFQGGGEMIKEVNYNVQNRNCILSWNELPWKFEAGTPNVSGVIAFAEAIKYLERLGMKTIFNHEKNLNSYAYKRMKELKKIIFYGEDIYHKCGIIPFGVENFSSHDVALFCDNYGIMIRSGFHCAQPLHEIFKLQSSARASFYIYNTSEEIDSFIQILQKMENF